MSFIQSHPGLVPFLGFALVILIALIATGVHYRREEKKHYNGRSAWNRMIDDAFSQSAHRAPLRPKLPVAGYTVNMEPEDYPELDESEEEHRTLH